MIKGILREVTRFSEYSKKITIDFTGINLFHLKRLSCPDLNIRTLCAEADAKSYLIVVCREGIEMPSHGIHGGSALGSPGLWVNIAILLN